jgi:hypothetical protein
VIWRGYTNTSWSIASNWNTGEVPSDTNSVYIPYGTPHQTNINGSSNYTVVDLTLDSLANISSDANASLFIKGNLFINSCGIELTNGLVVFNGTTPQYIYADCRIVFHNLSIENTSSTGVYLTGSSLEVGNDLKLIDGFLYTGGDTVVITNSHHNAIAEYNSDQSHVAGYLSRAIESDTNTYVFPLGKGTADGAYLVSIKNNFMTNVNRLTATFTDHDETPAIINSVLQNQILIRENGIVYKEISPEGMWTIEPDVQPSSGTYSIIAELKNFNSVVSDQIGILKKSSGSSPENWGVANAMSFS